MRPITCSPRVFRVAVTVLILGSALIVALGIAFGLAA
jgi:hypothetical protein